MRGSELGIWRKPQKTYSRTQYVTSSALYRYIIYTGCLETEGPRRRKRQSLNPFSSFPTSLHSFVCSLSCFSLSLPPCPLSRFRSPFLSCSPSCFPLVSSPCSTQGFRSLGHMGGPIPHLLSRPFQFAFRPPFLAISRTTIVHMQGGTKERALQAQVQIREKIVPKKEKISLALPSTFFLLYSCL